MGCVERCCLERGRERERVVSTHGMCREVLSRERERGEYTWDV